MVAYVLLIAIAFGLGAVTYNYLKGYLPSTLPECPADIAIAISAASCKTSSTQTAPSPSITGFQSRDIQLSLTNRGLFVIKEVFVRAGDPAKSTRMPLGSQPTTLSQSLDPSKTTPVTISFNNVYLPSPFIIEVQPAITDKKRGVIPCKNAIVTQLVSC